MRGCLFEWLDVCRILEYLGNKIGIMANFSLMEEDDYDSIFLTQQCSNNVVSLEESGDFKTVHNSEYSDISDDEQDDMEKRMR